MVNQLPQSQRVLVEAYFWKDQTISEIATRNGRDVNFVRKELRETLQTLATQLQ
jgi:DNA-directed RNA polymerase specialized sigma24 family protein